MTLVESQPASCPRTGALHGGNNPVEVTLLEGWWTNQILQYNMTHYDILDCFGLLCLMQLLTDLRWRITRGIVNIDSVWYRPILHGYNTGIQHR